MGYIKHHAIIVTSFGERYIKSTHEKAKEIFGATCTDIIKSPMNGYVTFFIAPDGSKEGWPDSDVGDEQRRQFEKWLKSESKFVDAIEVHYGGDDVDVNGVRNLALDDDEAV